MHIDIFLGGSMGDDRADGAGLKFSDHMPNMAKAIKRIIAEYDSQEEVNGATLMLLDPQLEAVGTISKRVFSMIERSELGIFDLSNASPSAMYELTLMHALGKPVIPVAFQQPKVAEARSLPHYLQDEYAILVKTYSEAELHSEIREKLATITKPNTTGIDAFSNPLTTFYGLPLVDVSATTGLAMGYFHNFLRHQLEANAPVFEDMPNLKGIAIVIPSKLQEVERLKAILKRRALEVDLSYEHVQKNEKGSYQAENQVRGRVLLDKIGDYLVDIPAPLSAQLTSPRRKKILDDRKEADPSARLDFDVRLERLEKAMIDRWFYTIQTLVNQSALQEDRLTFVTVDELFKLVA